MSNDNTYFHQDLEIDMNANQPDNEIHISQPNTGIYVSNPDNNNDEMETFVQNC